MAMRAEFFRQKAKECVALAKTMTDQLSRLELERTAAHWLRLADNADLLERLEKSSVGNARTVLAVSRNARTSARLGIGRVQSSQRFLGQAAGRQGMLPAACPS